jgi:SPOR domain
MTNEEERELGLQDEDRLPWLEAVEEDDDIDRVPTGKLVGFVAAALLALGIVVGGVWWLQSQKQGPEGDGTLIAAQEGDYKVKPEVPGGMKVEGQGDSAFAASEGAEANGKIDSNAQPETPVAKAGLGEPAAPAKPLAAGKAAVTAAVPASGGTLRAAPPAAIAAGAPGTVIQLGAYASEAIANDAWKRLAAGNAGLAKLPKLVVAANVNGKTYYRLRANAGTAANATATCDQVGNCIIVR